METSTSTNNTTSCYISASRILVRENTSTLRVHLILNGMGSGSLRKQSAPILIYNEVGTFFNVWMFVGCAS